MFTAKLFTEVQGISNPNANRLMSGLREMPYQHPCLVNGQWNVILCLFKCRENTYYGKTMQIKIYRTKNESVQLLFSQKKDEALIQRNND